ncbi:MAG: VapC toxin family PIN domain ribonuclease [Candidatus Parabeggiatoa sp. nov. 1]|nr:MAG: VapC toxin family PIN domain ribonuclease [Gammaproteobacteria bacterium]
MDIVIDTSAIIAVILGEGTKEDLLNLTKGANLIAPHSIHWEIGNAFSRLFKQKRITLEEAKSAYHFYQTIQIKFVDISMESALEMAEQLNIYAYDAYLISCAISSNAPLISLDNGLIQAAKHLNIEVLEVDS